MSNTGNRSLSILSWNVRGLGDSEKCVTVRDAIQAATPTVVCLQESKLQDISLFKVRTFLPIKLATSFDFAPSSGARGGMVTAYDASSLSRTNKIERPYTLTNTFSSLLSNISFTVTNVYAPSDHRHCQAFFAELSELLTLISGPWVLIGDFNLTRSVDDKNNSNFNFSLVESFNNAIQDIVVLEIPLLDTRYTWTNKRASPTLARLDRAFTNLDHCQTFPSTSLHSLPRPTSDHTPIMLNMDTTIPRPSTFRFKKCVVVQQHLSPFHPPGLGTC